MKVLGYNGGLDGYLAQFNASHDAAAVLVVDGNVVAGSEEERFSREKHSGKFPIQAMRYCLAEGGLKGFEELDLITYFHSFPLMWTDEMRQFNNQRLGLFGDLAARAWLGGMRSFHRFAGYNDFRSRRIFEKFTGYAPKSGQYQPIPHHMAHIASAYYTSPFDEGLCFSVDAQGEATSSLAVVAKGTDLEVINETFAPNSLGYLYQFITKYIGFKQHDEFKVMGLAPYGDPQRYRKFFQAMVGQQPDGTFDTRPELVLYLMMRDAFVPRQKLYPPHMVRELGKPRLKDEPVTQRHMDIAASLQGILEDAVFALLERLQKTSGQRNLCMAGGVALNCSMNGKLARSGMFDQIYIQPAAHDSGTSMGAALYGYYNVLMQPRPEPIFDRNIYLGPDHSAAETEQALQAFAPQIEFHKPEDLYGYTAAEIAKGKVVGWYQGRMEWGPRALGNRSIIADARRDDMKDIVNHAVKKREGFRPFAPAALLEDASEWFDMKGLDESPHMLFVVPVRDGQGEKIPAVTHVDNSARIQTIKQEDNPRFHALVTAFKEQTGVPVVLNTSFNIMGEPIVNTPQDAIRCFLGTKIDMLVVDDYVIEKKDKSERPASEFVPAGAQTGRVVGGSIAAV